MARTLTSRNPVTGDEVHALGFDTETMTARSGSAILEALGATGMARDVLCILAEQHPHVLAHAINQTVALKRL